MSTNKVLPSCAVLEVTMICIHASGALWDRYPANKWIDWIDAIFMILIPINLCYTITWSIYLRNTNYTTKLRIVRYCQAAMLAILAGLMIWTAFGVWITAEKVYFQNGKKNYVDYELRVIVGLLAVSDAFLHTLRPVLSSSLTAIGGKPPLGRDSPEHDLPSYEEPPSYSEVDIRTLSVSPPDESSGKHFPIPNNTADEVRHI